MSLPNSEYQRTKMLPTLQKHHVEKRKKWVIAFWIFWNSAKAVAPRVQLMLVHMDEKWFYAIVVRCNNKKIPFFGILPHIHSCGNKRLINKILVIVSTGFLPYDNDMEKGGVGVKFAPTRAGGMVKAKKDSFSRVYREDGSYHMPPILSNRLRVKGTSYFENWEITGSNQGSEKKKKFPLLDWFRDVEIPRLEKKAQEFEALNPGKKLLIKYQFDGAGCHNDKTLHNFIHYEFVIKRGWILVLQPPNSPILNTKDAALFPMLSKDVTTQQGIQHKSHAVSTENIWKLVCKCIENMDTRKIASAYAAM